MFILDLEKAQNQRSNCQHPLDHWRSKRDPEKHLLLLYWLCQSYWLRDSRQIMENSSRVGNTRTPDLPPEKFLWRSRSNNKVYLVSSGQFSHSVMSDSLQPCESQHTRPPCPLPTPVVHPCRLSQWCHQTISSSVIAFSSCPQSFPASECFWMSQLFASRGQSIGVSVSTSVPPMNTQDRSPLG